MSNHHRGTVLILLALCGSVFGQDFKKVIINNITSNRIKSIAQDSLGFLWIGTDEGLNRYDGLENQQYKSNIFDEKTLSSNRIKDIYIDNQNRVWVVGDRGVDLYNRKKNNFTRFPSKTRPIHLITNKQFIYITTSQSGVVVLNKETKETKKLSFDPLDPLSISSSRFSINQTTPIVIDGETMWLGTTNGLNKTNLKTQTSKRFYSDKTSFVERDTIKTVHKTKEGLLIGTSDGVVFYDDKKGASRKITENKTNNIREIKESEKLLLLGENKTILLDKDMQLFYEIKHREPKTRTTKLMNGQYLVWSPGSHETLLINTERIKEVEKGRLNITPEDVLIDNQSNIWIASNSGLFIASNIDNPVKLIKSKKIERDAVFTKKDDSHHVLFKKELYKTTTTGLYKLKSFQIEQHDRRNKIHISPGGQTYLYGEDIRVLNSTNKPKTIFKGTTPINFLTSDTNIIIGSFQNSGIFCVDKQNKKTYDYRENRLIAKNLPTGASSILIDKKTVWFGSDESGLYEVDISKPEKPSLIKHHTYKKEEPNSFASSSVSCIEQVGKNIVIGTNGDGVFIHTKEKTFARFSNTEGLPSNNIISISSSSDSIIWVLTKAGVSIINSKTGEINNLGKTEGLGEFIEEQPSLVTTKNGNALIMEETGFYVVDKEKIHVDDFQQKVTINTVELYDRNNKGKETIQEPVIVTHETPTLNISFSAPTFYKADETTYSYKIKGYNDSWVDNGKKRSIALQGFDYGLYTVMIKSYNSDGYESKNTAELNFQIIPPWWETWWAYLSYTILIFGSVFYYIKYQTKAQQKAAEDQRKEEELEEARQFQLDMLPRETPKDLGLDISATIQTASEVGGDYYDYFPQEDKESLYVVVGDATGHGMTAGMMVSITKAGLYGIPSIPPNEIAKRLNTVIKAIDLGWNRMAFNMARFWDDRVEFTSAAMPPAYHYHGETGEVDEILLGGLPLGSIKDETFALEELPFKKGDSLVFLSDGLPEATNKTDEMLGYEAVLECVKANGEKNAEGQRDALLELGTTWLEDLQNQDDITIVVVKKTNPLD